MEDIFVSKIKRLAVAMFAALCVGNVWGKEGAVYLEQSCTLSPEGVLAVKDYFAYFWQTDARTFTTRISYKVNDGNVITKDLKTTGVFKPATSSTDDAVRGGGEYTVEIEGFRSGAKVWVKYELVYSAEVGGVTSQSKEYTFDMGGVLTSECEWLNEPKKFIVSGVVGTDGYITSVKIKYVVGTIAVETLPEDAKIAEADYNPSTGEYRAMMDYSTIEDVLSWSAYAVYEGGTEKVFADFTNGKTVLNCKKSEGGNVHYYWTNSKGDGKWNTVGNWDANPKRSYNGAPGNFDGSYYTSVACFTNSAIVNLNGGTYRLWDTEGEVPYRGIQLEKGDNENMKVTLTNGIVQVLGASKLWVGTSGNTLEFGDKCVLDYTDSKDTTALCLVGGSTVIFSGNSTQPWFFKPIKQGNGQTTFIVKDGAIKSNYRLDSDTISDSLTVRIENATWTISTQTPSSGLLGFHDLGARTVFRDGAKQAQLNLSSCSGFTLSKVYDFKLPAKPFNTPYITGKNLTSISNCTIEVDVTDLAGRAKVPLMKFDSVKDGGSASAEELTNKPDKLIVTANGRNVKTRQRAKLEWDATAKTLYYVQDPVKGFRVIVR